MSGDWQLVFILFGTVLYGTVPRAIVGSVHKH
jgi:hypothetical protein